MAFLSSMGISASAMSAQRLRMDVASENIANEDTTRTESGGPYRRKMVVFQPMDASRRSFRSVLEGAASGVQGGVKVTAIVEDPRPTKLVYNPNHPDANEEGYVEMPNVDFLKETVDAMEAARAYEANITALNATKLMATKALEIGR